jgi:hypothetical protein
VRSIRGEEGELTPPPPPRKHVSNLCSAFSYCLTSSLLGTPYVWHGKGSLLKERQAAFGYAQSLSAEGTSPVELVERESDDDEMFWMLLGDADDYASADYWKWRPTSVTVLPQIWRVDALSPPHVSRKTTILISYTSWIDLHNSSQPSRRSLHNQMSTYLCTSSTAFGSYSWWSARKRVVQSGTFAWRCPLRWCADADFSLSPV